MLKTLQYSLLFLAVAGEALTCPAQSKHESRRPKRPPGAVMDAPDRWKEFSSEEGGFIVSFPGVPEESSVPVPLPVGEPLLHVVAYKSPAVTYVVMYTSCPVDANDADAVDDYFDNLRIGELESETLVGRSPRVSSEAAMPLDQYPGRFLQIDMKDAVYRRRAVFAQGRLYVLTATALNRAGSAAATAKTYERLSLRFLNSFDLMADEGLDRDRVGG